MKHLKYAILVLLLPAMAQAAEFGYTIVDTTAQQSLGNGTVVLKGLTTSGLKYTATTGDIVDSLRFFSTNQGGLADTIDVLIGLYAASGTEPGTRVLLDTAKVGALNDWYGVGVTDGSGGFNLTDGVTYMIFVAELEATDYAGPYYDAGGTDDGIFLDANAAPSSWPGGSSLPRKYAMIAVYHNDGADTCSVVHNLTATDTTSTTVTIQDDYTWTPGTMDSISMIWGSSSDPEASTGRASDDTPGFPDPISFQATGLGPCVSYNFWIIHWPDGCTRDTSAVLTIQTLCPVTRSTKLGS